MSVTRLDTHLAGHWTLTWRTVMGQDTHLQDWTLTWRTVMNVIVYSSCVNNVISVKYIQL